MISALQICNPSRAGVVERDDGVVIRQLEKGASLDVTEYTVPHGFTTGASDHETYEKAGYVVRGKVEIRTGDEAVVVEAGGAYALPLGVPHQFTVLEDSVIVQVRSPATAPTPART
jgi:uncharacterized RmlC-like cupin family protein